MSTSNTMNSIIDDTATLGKATTSITFIISIIIAVILIICAIMTGNKPQKPFIKAFISSAKCDSYSKMVNRNKEIRYSCLLKLKYTINNVEYLNDLSIDSSTVYNPNTYIDIEYEQLNPNVINIKGLDNSTQSYISLGIAAVIVGFAWFNMYLTSKSKVYATFQGASALGSVFSSSVQPR